MLLIALGYLGVAWCQESITGGHTKIAVKNCFLFSTIFKEIAVTICVVSNIVFDMNSMRSMDCHTSAEKEEKSRTCNLAKH